MTAELLSARRTVWRQVGVRELALLRPGSASVPVGPSDVRDGFDAIAREPRVDLFRIEADEAADPDEWDAALVDQFADEPDLDAQTLCQGWHVDQRGGAGAARSGCHGSHASDRDTRLRNGANSTSQEKSAVPQTCVI